MSDPTQNLDLAARAVLTGQAVARLATDDVIFRAAVDAFRAGDTDSFLRLLTRIKATQYCEEICRWFASKECVLECLELCGIPKVDLTLEQIAAGTAEIARVSSNLQAMETLADIIERRDTQSFAAFVKEQKLQEYCRLVCHWACSIHFGLICEILCGPPIQVPERSLAAQLSLSGNAIGQLAKNPTQLRSIIDAAIKLNCEFLSGIVGGFNDCIFICRWICSWRSIYVCSPVCRILEIPKDIIDEERQFAQLSGRLADGASNYQRLFNTIEIQDLKAYQSLVNELQIGPFCFQLCHWISYEVCNRFCYCVCPEPETIPLFTKVGQYHVDPIYGDFQANGTTTAGGYAFSTSINLNGLLPDGTAPDALEYRFTYQQLSPVAGAVTPLTSPAITSATIIGQLEYYYWNSVLSIWMVGSTDFYVNNPGATANITQQFGPALTPSVDTDSDVNGWIQVPRYNSLFQGGVGRFVPTGLLAQLDTTQLTLEPFDLTIAGPGLPVVAGVPVPLAQQSVKPTFTINFEARNVTTLASVGANSLAVIALSNTEYTYTRHPDWAGGVVGPMPPVVSLDILEMQAGGCQPLGVNANTLHALFTVYHPYLGSCSLTFVGPAPLPTVTLPAIPADGDVVSGTAGLAVDISMLVPCAYVVFLNANLNLTNGDSVLYGTFQDFIAFCRR